MGRNDGVSISVIKRLPRYYRFLGELKENGAVRISSKDLSEKMGFKSDSLEEFYKNWTEYEAMYKFNESNENISKYYSELGSYILTAVCANTDEKFELYKSF